MDAKKSIAITLSGGGVRAVAFHAGVMRRLAEIEQLQHIGHISTVSGGSLFLGLMFHRAGYSWPSNQQYLDEVAPSIRQLLTTQSLQGSAIWRLLNPCNWRHLLSRANIVAQTISSVWGIQGRLADLPETPIWSINGTTGETGKRFRFKQKMLGDYVSGYAPVKDFTLASAMAMSAAFPGGIGPLTLDTSTFEWVKRPHWGSPDVLPYQPQFRTLHLYDGGIYDNLGLEPVFDVGKQEFRSTDGSPSTYLLVSDAGLTCAQEAVPHPLNPARFKRLADIALEQTRALRVRALMNFMKMNPLAASYIQIGSSLRRAPEGTFKVDPKEPNWLSSDEILKAALLPTSLCMMDPVEFDLVERHGYETTYWAAKNLSGHV